MKTPEKIAGELSKNIIIDHGWGSKSLLIESLEVFEAEIRKDQTRICADSILELDTFTNHDATQSITVNEVLAAIMNVNTEKG